MPTPFVPALNVAQVAMRFIQAGQRVENVYNVHNMSAWSALNMIALAQGFKDWWVTNLAPLVTSELVLDSIVVTDLTTSTSTQIIFVSGLPTPGENTNVGLPMNVTVAVRWNTASRGRSYRGRTYHLGLNRANVVGSLINTATQAALKAAYDTLITDVFAVGTSDLVVLSKRSANAWRTAAVFTTIGSSSVELTIDSQRRRLPGRGD